jgi:dephospho-CoA kinase
MGSPPGRVPFVGLTGGLGAGKSEALRALGELGAATLSTDDVVHALLASELHDAVVERLGPEVAPDGPIDRALVARRVFGDDEARAWLEGMLWPRVGERVAAWRATLADAAPPPRAAVVEVPLLFESGMEGVFDHTIAVVADEATRERRAAARRHAEVASRTARQLPQEEKAQRADFTVRNEGTLQELKASLSRVLAKLDTGP